MAENVFQVPGVRGEGRVVFARPIDAMTLAWFRRGPAEGLIFHCDRRSQYASANFQDVLNGYGMCGSMSQKADSLCANNDETSTP